MGVSGKTSKVSSVVAALCITVYIVAIVFGAARIIINIGERRDLAEREFYDLADRASSAAVSLGFMSEAYRETIRDFLTASETLLGIIITGSSDEYAFERYQGSGIVWSGDSPRFKTSFPVEPFYLPLRIDGQRNVTIQAVHNNIDYNYFTGVLRTTLFIVLVTMAVAFMALLLELIQKNKSNASAVTDPSHVSKPVYSRPDYSEPVEAANNFPYEEFAPEVPEEDKHPTGLFTPRSNIGWESYTYDRLTSELHRCASFEQDLVFMAIEPSEKISDPMYRKFTEEAVIYFAMRDLIFEKGEQGISVIIPSTDLEQGIAKSEEFRRQMKDKLRNSSSNSKGLFELCIGLSSRSGRLVEADRLMLEASTALKKAQADPVSHIIAFKTDLEKYRKFIKHQS